MKTNKFNTLRYRTLSRSRLMIFPEYKRTVPWATWKGINRIWDYS